MINVFALIISAEVLVKITTKKIQAENLASISHKKETRKNITCITVENVVKWIAV